MNTTAITPSLVQQPNPFQNAPARQVEQFIIERGPDLSFTYSKVDSATQEVVWTWPGPKGAALSPPTSSSLSAGVSGVAAEPGGIANILI